MVAHWQSRENEPSHDQVWVRTIKVEESRHLALVQALQFQVLTQGLEAARVLAAHAVVVADSPLGHRHHRHAPVQAQVHRHLRRHEQEPKTRSVRTRHSFPINQSTNSNIVKHDWTLKFYGQFFFNQNESK